MASECEAIVEQFDKKAKARKAVVSKPNKQGKTRVISIRHGDGSYGPAFMNKNIYSAELGPQLMNLHGLGMKEVVGEFMGRHVGATFFNGSDPIDTIWVTSNLEVAHACVMPVGYGVGDHPRFVVDDSTTSMIGTCPPKIIQPALRRLNTKIPGCALQYNWALRKNILHHQFLECMICVAESDDCKEAILAKLNQLDWEGEKYMKHAEKKCLRIKVGRIPFSPEASLWTCQCQVYCSLLSTQVACRKDLEQG